MAGPDESGVEAGAGESAICVVSARNVLTDAGSTSSAVEAPVAAPPILDCNCRIGSRAGPAFERVPRTAREGGGPRGTHGAASAGLIVAAGAGIGVVVGAGVGVAIKVAVSVAAADATAMAAQAFFTSVKKASASSCCCCCKASSCCFFFFSCCIRAENLCAVIALTRPGRLPLAASLAAAGEAGWVTFSREDAIVVDTIRVILQQWQWQPWKRNA